MTDNKDPQITVEELINQKITTQELLDNLHLIQAYSDAKTSDELVKKYQFLGRFLHSNGDIVIELLLQLSTELKQLRAVKDGAYSERNKLVAALSKLFPAWLERHPDSDTTWEDDWRWIVFIQLPTGQASWHIHDSELEQFNHLECKDGNSWDGHTTDEKYSRLASITGVPELKQLRAERAGLIAEIDKEIIKLEPRLYKTDSEIEILYKFKRLKSKLTDSAQRGEGKQCD